MPSRVVRGMINRSESLNRVSVPAELTFHHLILAVDDYGRLDARPLILKAELFPLRDEATPDLIAGWIAELVADGCVQTYEVANKPYLALTNWEKHRGEGRRGDASKYPPPPGLEDPVKTPPVVYFLQAGEGGQIKIGWTSNLQSRIATLSTMVPNAILLGVIRSPTRALEKKLHRQFSELRQNGEWFKPNKKLLAFIHAKAERPPDDDPGRGVQKCPGTGQDGRGTNSPTAGCPTEGRGTRDEGRESRGGRRERPAAVPPPPRTSSSRKKETPAPRDLDPADKEKLRDFVRSRYPQHETQLRAIVDKCLNHHRSKGKLSADWEAECEIWIANEWEKPRGPRVHAVRRPRRGSVELPQQSGARSGAGLERVESVIAGIIAQAPKE